MVPEDALKFSIGLELEFKLEHANYLGLFLFDKKELSWFTRGIDRSVDGTYKRGCEIRTRPTNLLHQLFRQIDMIYENFLPLRAETTNTTGLHIHIDYQPHYWPFAEEYARRIAAIIIYWLPVENAFIEAAYGKGWRKNKGWLKRMHYCKPWRDFLEYIIHYALMMNRYHALNILSAHTFEIRVFPSTIDPEQCKKWVRMAVDWASKVDLESPELVNKSIEVKRTFETLDPQTKKRYRLV